MSDHLYVVSADQLTAQCQLGVSAEWCGKVMAGTLPPSWPQCSPCPGCRSDGTRTVIPEGAVEVERGEVYHQYDWVEFRTDPERRNIELPEGAVAFVAPEVSGTPEENDG